jgi:hypothetical protein
LSVSSLCVCCFFSQSILIVGVKFSFRLWFVHKEIVTKGKTLTFYSDGHYFSPLILHKQHPKKNKLLNETKTHVLLFPVICSYYWAIRDYCWIQQKLYSSASFPPMWFAIGMGLYMNSIISTKEVFKLL